jgi:hypothetical protein
MNQRAPVIDTCQCAGQQRLCKWHLAWLVLYMLFLMLPIYWLINMSFKTNAGDPVDVHADSAQIRPCTITP